MRIDEGVEVLNEFPSSNLITLADAIKTASQIKRLVVGHTRIDASSGTFCKTPVGPGGYPGPRAPILDFIPPG